MGALATESVERLGNEMARIIRTRIESDRLVLPAMPTAASKCLAIIKDPEFPIRRLIEALETSPLFALQVVRAASIAALGGQPVRSLEAAINRLGVNQLRVVLTQAAARSLFESRDRAIAGRLSQVWQHSVAVAILARDVGAVMRVEDSEIVYLSGLLHDIGKPVVASLLLEAESQLGKKGWITAEQWSRVVDDNHRTIGIALAERWNLDVEVVQAVRDCHEYDAGDRRCAANVVRFANALVKTQGVCGGAVDLDDANALVMIGRSMLDLDDEVVQRLSSGLKERVNGLIQPGW
ncbi:MAG TPA: HDOD domain-containing protein [Kofleriaceae bacterium]|nr:HDOD domain-containing protein [Kofleriaceae bacterium]